MPKRGLPTGVKMRHDAHYVEELAQKSKTVGKIIDIDLIYPNPDQPRSEFGDLSELVSSIREQGVLEPLLVQPKGEKFMIIAGERRFRASTEVGLTELPCVALDVDDKTVAEIALVENLQRKDLTVWETSDGLQDLVDRFGYTHEQVAERIGKSRTAVTESLAIAGLPESIRSRCREHKIKAKSKLVEISRGFDEDAMHEIVDGFASGSKPKKAKEPKKVEKPAEVAEVPEVKEEPPKGHRYVFEAEDEFKVTIQHFNEEDVSRTDLLRALKSAFDAIKSGS